MDHRINQLTIGSTLDRTAVKTDFGVLLARGLTSGAAVASAIVPGGAIISAAVNGTAGRALDAVTRGASSHAGREVGGFGGASSTGATDHQALTGSSSTGDSLSEQRQMIEENRKWTTQYLTLQNEMQQESREFNAVSNILKVRHESAKTAINNIR
ncbi:MAG: hypothetical protein HY901_29615 [Deltaproteobacteria bacterium]|nr:hypothetical protein [Deltaproteobacteria bacterium]